MRHGGFTVFRACLIDVGRRSTHHPSDVQDQLVSRNPWTARSVSLNSNVCTGLDGAFVSTHNTAVAALERQDMEEIHRSVKKELFDVQQARLQRGAGSS